MKQEQQNSLSDLIRILTTDVIVNPGKYVGSYISVGLNALQENDGDEKAECNGIDLAAILAYCRSRGLDPAAPAAFTDDDVTELLKLQQQITEWLKADPQREAQQAISVFEKLKLQPIRTKELEFGIDKANSTIWSVKAQSKDFIGTEVQLKADGRKTKTAIDLIYSISFDGLPDYLTKRLSAYDERVYNAVGALFSAGNKTVTTPMIYRAMGYSGKQPNKKDEQKIRESMQKMRGAVITLDNKQEIDNKYRYPLFRYNGTLLPSETVTATINGLEVAEAINIFREPPLLSFARGRRQISKVPLKLLQVPVNMTDGNVALVTYLQKRIAHDRDAGKQQSRILYATLFKELGIDDTKQRQRTRATVTKILEYWKGLNDIAYILDYTIDRAGLTCVLNADQGDKKRR